MLGTNTEQSCNGTVPSSSLGPQLGVSGSTKIRLFCSSCNQEFTSTSELNEHMERHNSEIEEALLQHTGMPPSVTMTTSTSSTTQHQRSLNTVAHTCMYCGMQFREQNALMSHQKTLVYVKKRGLATSLI